MRVLVVCLLLLSVSGCAWFASPEPEPAPLKPLTEAEQTALIESVRRGEPINSGYHMAGSTMVTVMGISPIP